ncbi:glucose-6-phosphate exchanger SLC37A4 [Caerostris darwini]|uniref:Glucose-6-phosphate exchanger SLC37A4 n=1 Tax=Caerostris darwini TaxID=1538125 RepID=A0AAV4T6W2_9ARAC|nr:glucose-6-phosphate exchanger SLC37A4 [Caerostris darwini]
MSQPGKIHKMSSTAHAVMPHPRYLRMLIRIYSVNWTDRFRLFHYEWRRMGLIISCQNAAFAISKFMAGVLSDRTNPRLLFASGLMLSGVTTLSFSTSSSLPVFCALWFVNGLAQGCGWPSCVKFIKQRAPPSRFGSLWSTLSSGNNLSGCVSPILSAYLLTHFGWRTSVGISGVTSIVLAFFCLIALEESAPSASSEKKLTSKKQQSEDSASFFDLLREPFLWVVSAGFLVVFGAKTTLVDWGQLYLMEERKRSQQDGSAFTSGLESGGILGRIVAGYLTDYLIQKQAEKPYPVSERTNRARTRLSVAILLMFISGLLLHALQSTVKESSSTAWIVCLAFVLGVSLYGPITLFGITASESAPTHLSGSAHAIASLAGNVGAMLSGFPFCYIAKLHGWSAVLVLLECAMGAAVVLMLACRNLNPTLTSRQKED